MNSYMPILAKRLNIGSKKDIGHFLNMRKTVRRLLHVTIVEVILLRF